MYKIELTIKHVLYNSLEKSFITLTITRALTLTPFTYNPLQRPNSSSPCLQSSPPTNGQLDLDEFSDIEDDDDLLSGHELSIVLDVSSHCNRDDSIDSDADVEAAIANGLLHFDDQGEQFNSDEADTVAPPPPQQQQVSQGHVVDFNNAIPQTS